MGSTCRRLIADATSSNLGIDALIQRNHWRDTESFNGFWGGCKNSNGTETEPDPCCQYQLTVLWREHENQTGTAANTVSCPVSLQHLTLCNQLGQVFQFVLVSALIKCTILLQRCATVRSFIYLSYTCSKSHGTDTILLVLDRKRLDLGKTL